MYLGQVKNTGFQSTQKKLKKGEHKTMVSTAQALETEFINATLIKNSPTRRGVVLNEGTYELSDYGERLTLLVEIDNKRKKWRPNRDSVENCNNILGTDTKHWVGHIIMFTPITIQGKDSVMGVPDPAGVVKPISLLNTPSRAPAMQEQKGRWQQ